MERRQFLAAAGALARRTAGRSRSSSPVGRYPDPAVKVHRPELRPLPPGARRASSSIASGMRWTEGPIYFGDGRYLLWSDIPNNRIMRWDEETGAVTAFRKPSNFANGNTRDRQGRLLTCEHGTRRVSRTEYDGTDHRHRRPLRRQAAQLAERHRLQVRRLDLVHRPAVRHARLLRGLHRQAGAADQRLPLGREDAEARRGRRRHQPARTASRSRPTSRSCTSSKPAPTPRVRAAVRRGGRRHAAVRQALAHRPPAGGTPDGFKRRHRRQPVDGLGHGQPRRSTASRCSTRRAS